MINIDFNILNFLQNIRTPFLDKMFVIITSIPGNYGQMWIMLGLLLLVFKKTRKCGLNIIISYILVYGIGQYILKDLLARPRPCHIIQTIDLLIKCPSSYSCPSTHSAWAFAGAFSVFLYNKKFGIPVMVFSILIALSRMYLFVHFPSDVLFGIVLGIIFSIISKLLIEKISKVKSKNN